MNNLYSEKLATLLHQNNDVEGQKLSDHEIQAFCRYYDLVLKWNPRLHLTTITDPDEFFWRHICESIFATNHLLTSIQEVWDIGTGLGIPGIPIAVLRPHLAVKLVEANQKKSIFLKETAFALKLQNVQVRNERFEEINALPQNFCVITRALDDMNRLLPKILQFGQTATQIILLGNAELQTSAQNYLGESWQKTTLLLPESQSRYLISFSRST